MKPKQEFTIEECMVLCERAHMFDVADSLRAINEEHKQKVKELEDALEFWQKDIQGVPV